MLTIDLWRRLLSTLVVTLQPINFRRSTFMNLNKNYALHVDCCDRVVEVRGRCCRSERTLLSKWEDVVVEVRGRCCRSERTLLSKWEDVVVEVRGRCCRSERTLLSKWEDVVVEVRGRCCRSEMPLHWKEWDDRTGASVSIFGISN